MKKIVRLTENDLVNLVKKVISEQTTTNYVDSTYLKDEVAYTNSTLVLTQAGRTFFTAVGNVDAQNKPNRNVLKLDFLSEDAKLGLANKLGTNWKALQGKIMKDSQSQFGTIYVIYKPQQVSTT